MYQFIPAWYSAQYKWHMDLMPWHSASRKSGFDDAIGQIHMFQEAGDQEITLMTLCYAPQLRRYIYREGIDPLRCWNAFDEIQNIKNEDVQILSFLDLEWPPEIEWIYTPFVVMGYLNGQHFANVDFAQDGNLLWIDYFETDEDEKESLYYREIYDDRGFASSTIDFVHGQAQSIHYYDEEGYCQITEMLPNGIVTIEDERRRDFQKQKYSNMDELINEVVIRHFDTLSKDDFIVLAADPLHDHMVMEARRGWNIVLSFFGNRYDERALPDIAGLLKQAKIVVSDTEEMATALRKVCGDEAVPILDISPFDARIKLGISQQIRELKIFMPIDDLVEPIRTRALRQILELLEEDERVRLIIGTTELNHNKREKEVNDQLRMLVQEFVQAGKELLIINEPKKKVSENEMETTKDRQRSPQIFVETYQFEADVMRILHDIRLIVDIRDTPDQYIQIAGISAGIPQINYRNTRYIEHEKNGYMIHNIANLRPAINYYLTGLEHWNQALVHCVNQISRYRSGRIVSKWKEMLNEYDG